MNRLGGFGRQKLTLRESLYADKQARAKREKETQQQKEDDRPRRNSK